MMTTFKLLTFFFLDASDVIPKGFIHTKNVKKKNPKIIKIRRQQQKIIFLWKWKEKGNENKFRKLISKKIVSVTE